MSTQHWCGDAGKIGGSHRKIRPNATFFSVSHTRTGLGSKPGLFGGTPVTDRLRHGMTR